MDGLRLNFQGETRVFSPDGNVTIDGQTAVKGTWRTAAQGAEAKENKIRYVFNGASQPDVPVKYSFNEKNQLVAVIPAASNGGTDSAPFAFLGSVEVDDSHDIVYRLIAPDGKLLPKSITVYGDLQFAENTNNLVITLTGGGSAELKGSNGVGSLTPLRNNLPGFKSADLLSFRAYTENKLSTGQSKLSQASIGIPGKWDLQGDQLVFLGEAKGSATRPDLKIGFAGKYKAVSGGLVYFADKEGTKIAFNVSGAHRWNSGAGKWDVTVGYTGKTFAATMKGDLKINKKLGDNRELALSGDFAIETGTGVPTTVKMEVNAAYTWSKENKLIVQALVDPTKPALNYDIKVEGKFVYKKGIVTFGIRYSSDGLAGFEISYKGTEGLIGTLTLILEPKDGKIDVSFEFEMRMVWENGKLVKKPPQPLAS